MSQGNGSWRLGLFLLLGGVLFLPGAGFAPAPGDVNRALALAQAGVLDAEAKLQAYFPVHTFDSLTLPKPWRFWSSDPTETVEPYAGDRPETASNPSFAVELDNDPANTDPTPRTMKIEGMTLGYSGAQGPATYATNGDHYSLKVSDLSGRIHVNDGIENGPTGSVSQNLKRILNNLGQVLSEALLGDRILAGRPAGGYVNLNDLLPALGSEQSFNKVRDFVTVRAWVDRNVANPVPLSSATLSRYPVQYARGTPRVLRHGSSPDAIGIESSYYDMLDTIPNAGNPTIMGPQSAALYGLDTLNPQWIEIVGRAPVNVNSAPREVLVALLSGLQGFFISERKRNNARWEGDILLSIKLESSYSTTGTEGDEYGYLMETYPFAPAGGGIGISPFTVANELIACRNRKASSNFNYATVSWGGPFRTWHQFNLFVDNLVAIGVLYDPRDIHRSYEEEGADPTGFNNLMSDDLQKLQAARAIADVLKANFNPNLHLNELNPNANLHLRVDKTDLFVNSTEFCFVPTGFFEVESVGRVVKPQDAAADVLAASDNRLMAQAKVVAVLQLYDLYRETTQKQFYGGTLTPRITAIDTSNDMTLEIGPEPDNGVFPGNAGAGGTADNEWDGYLALSTIGGPWHANPLKAKNTLVKTLDYTAAPHLTANMHAHYSLDADACDHVLDRREIAGRTLAEEEVRNHPSIAGGVPLSYGRPNDLAKGNHRLARSFRISGTTPPVLTPAAPSDLRIDGLYAERNCAPAYYAHQGTSHLWNFNGANAHGMVNFWLKPSFYPESTGKIRKFWDMTRHHSNCGSNLNVWPFGLVFMPVHYNHGVSDVSQPQFWHNNMGKFQSCSMYFGSSQWHTDDQYTTGNSHGFGKITSCLNHIGNSDENLRANPLQAHRWINIAFSWGLVGSDAAGNSSKLYINGTSVYSQFSYASMTGFNEGYDRMNGFEKHSGGAFNHMRVGGTSRVADAALALTNGAGGYRGNYSSDATLDELYVWQTDIGVPADTLWVRGRYCNLRNQTGNEGTFASQAIALPPAAGGGSAPVKILGASWTWYGEDVDPFTGARILNDYSASSSGTPSRDLLPAVDLTIADGGGLSYGPFSDDGFSPVLSLAGTTPTIQNPSQVKYGVHFRMGAAGAFPIVLGTPVFDDVTIYWSDGRASTRVDTSTPLSITNPATLPDGDRGTVYGGMTFTAAGGGTVTWSATGVPPGLSLDPVTGAYGGTPSSGGQYTVVVTASSGGQTSTASYPQLITGAPASSGGGGGGGGGGCGLLGAEAALATLLLRLLARRR